MSQAFFARRAAARQKEGGKKGVESSSPSSNPSTNKESTPLSPDSFTAAFDIPEVGSPNADANVRKNKRVRIDDSEGSKSTLPPTDPVLTRPFAAKSGEVLKPFFDAKLREKFDNYPLEEIIKRYRYARDYSVRSTSYLDMALLHLVDRHELLTELKELHAEKATFNSEKESMLKDHNLLRTQVSELSKEKDAALLAQQQAELKLSECQADKNKLQESLQKVQSNYNQLNLRVVELELLNKNLTAEVDLLKVEQEKADENLESFGAVVRNRIIDQIAFYNPGIELRDVDKIDIYNFVEGSDLFTDGANGEKILILSRPAQDCLRGSPSTAPPS